jgi:hypothetical protein
VESLVQHANSCTLAFSVFLELETEHFAFCRGNIQFKASFVGSGQSLADD